MRLYTVLVAPSIRVSRTDIAATLTLAVLCGCRAPASTSAQVAEQVVTHPPSSASAHRIAPLIADLGESKGGLRAPYCMPFPRSSADDAYEALLKIGKPAVPALIAGLSDKNTYRRAHCAGLLGEIGDARAVEPLCGMVGTEKNAKDWFIHALGRLKDPRAIDALIPLLAEGSGEIHSLPAIVPTTGRMAADALAKIGQPAVAKLEEAKKSKNPDVQTNARHALLLIGDS